MPRRPNRITIALLALSGAWMASATALFVNQVLHSGAGMGPGPTLGVASLVVQAIVIVLVARRSTAGRSLAVVILVIAALSLPLAPKMASQGQLLSAICTTVGFVLKAAAVWLLFTGHSTEDA